MLKWDFKVTNWKHSSLEDATEDCPLMPVKRGSLPKLVLEEAVELG